MSKSTKESPTQNEVSEHKKPGGIIGKFYNPYKFPDWHTGVGERFSYYSFFFGQNIIYNTVTVFITTYMLFLGIDPAKSATVLLLVKIWDAVNDAIFGVIFDSVKFKSGKKFTPWLKVSSIFAPITTILMFVIPNGSTETVKLAWFSIAYILWDSVYTLSDVPIYGIITVMSDNQNERTSLQSYKSIYSGAGMALSTLICTVLVSEKIGLSFGIASMILAVFAFATMMPAGFKLNERLGNNGDDEKFTIRRMFYYLLHNKYLLIYYLGFLFYSGTQINNALNLYVSYYLFNNSLFSLVISAVTSVPSVLLAFFVPTILRKFDKMTVFRFCVALAALLGIVSWAVGYKSIVVYIIFMTLKTIPLSTCGIMLFLFTPDCAEYGKYSTGIEAKGITFAIQTFVVKLSAAFSTALGLFILGLKSVGWHSVEVESFEALKASGVTQTPHALSVLWFAYTMIPALGCVVAYIVWRFYKLKDKDVQVMTECNAGLMTKEDADKAIGRKL